MSYTNQALERIAAIQITIGVPGLGIPVVLQAEPYQPSDMSSVSCPFFVNEIAGGATDLPIADGEQYVETEIHMMLAVERRVANIDLKYGVKETLQWRDAVLAMFAQHIKLSAPQVLIKSSTNAGPIMITTGTPHCLAASDQVTIANHLINTAANGNWNTVATSPTAFTLTGSTGNGAGGATGTARMLQPGDLSGFVTSFVIKSWDLVPYIYGAADFLALRFVATLKEMYVTSPMAP